MRLLAFCIVDMLNLDLNLLHCRYAEHGFELEIIALLILTRILEIHFATQNGAPSLPSPEALPFAVLFPSPSVLRPSPIVSSGIPEDLRCCDGWATKLKVPH